MPENERPPGTMTSSERAFVGGFVVLFLAALLEIPIFGSLWLFGVLMSALVLVAISLSLQDRSRLAAFAEATTDQWEAEHRSFESSSPRFCLNLETTVSAPQVAEALNYFLQTSPWGTWKPEEGDTARRRYRRGAWLAPTRPEPAFFTKFLRVHRNALVLPEPGTATAPPASNQWGYSIWPMLLDVSLRPTVGVIQLQVDYQSFLGPNLSGTDALGDAEPYLRNRCRLIDYYGRCAIAETDALVNYLTESLRLQQRPSLQRC